MGVLKEFWQEEDAVGVVEIILILVVLIGLANNILYFAEHREINNYFLIK